MKNNSDLTLTDNLQITYKESIKKYRLELRNLLLNYSNCKQVQRQIEENEENNIESSSTTIEKKESF